MSEYFHFFSAILNLLIQSIKNIKHEKVSKTNNNFVTSESTGKNICHIIDAMMYTVKVSTTTSNTSMRWSSISLAIVYDDAEPDEAFPVEPNPPLFPEVVDFPVEAEPDFGELDFPKKEREGFAVRACVV
jgi:hypothetical protein